MRLTDLDKFEQFVERLCEKSEMYRKNGTHLVLTAERLKQVLSNMPVIDAEPVRHGLCQKSTERNEWYAHNYTCMECGAIMMVWDADGTDIEPKCCANCGVKMDGDDHGTEQR